MEEPGCGVLGQTDAHSCPLQCASSHMLISSDHTMTGFLSVVVALRDFTCSAPVLRTLGSISSDISELTNLIQPWSDTHEEFLHTGLR